MATMNFHFVLSGISCSHHVLSLCAKWEMSLFSLVYSGGEALFVSIILTISHFETNNEIIFYT